MASTCANYPDSSSHTHEACLLALGSHTLSDHWSTGDKLNCRSDEYPEKHATDPRNEQRTELLS
jgi:hypothetical protein